MDILAAERLLEKLRRFIAEDLDEEERTLFAVLLGQGVVGLYGEAPSEVHLYGDDEAPALPGFVSQLVRALRTAGVRVEGLGLG